MIDVFRDSREFGTRGEVVVKLEARDFPSFNVDSCVLGVGLQSPPSKLRYWPAKP